MSVGIHCSTIFTNCGLAHGARSAMAAGVVIDSFGKCRVCIWLLATHGSGEIALKFFLTGIVGNACAHELSSANR